MAQVVTSESAQSSPPPILRGLNNLFNSVEMGPCNFECLGFGHPPPSVVQHLPYEQHTAFLLRQISRYTIYTTTNSNIVKPD
jgi:hypothetical protein